MERHRLSSAIVLSIAIVVSGIMLPVAVKNYRAFERTITVKGLCEREVEATPHLQQIPEEAHLLPNV